MEPEVIDTKLKPVLYSFFITTITVVFFLVYLSIFNTVDAARFEASPTTANLKSQCNSTVQIYADPQGNQSNAADFLMSFNPSEVEIIDSNPNKSGINVKEGNAYESYFINNADNTTGEIVVAAGSFSQNLSTRKLFAEIRFRSKPGVNSTDFTINFDGIGVTTDSNIAEASTSIDLLSGVTNSSYTFSVEDCVADVVAPSVTFLSPINNATGISDSQIVRIRVTDSQSGIDIGSAEITIDGQTYEITDSEFSFTGNEQDYIIEIQPRTSFVSDVESSIQIRITDFRGNTRFTQNIINRQPDLSICPVPDSTDNQNNTDTESRAGSDELNNKNNASATNTTNLIDPAECPAPNPSQDVDPTTVPTSGELNNRENFFDNQIVNLESDNPLILFAFNLSTPRNILSFSSSALLLISFLSYLRFIVSPVLLGKFMNLWLLNKSLDKPTGIVLDSSTDKPIPFTVLRLYLSNTYTLRDQVVSNDQGVYSFNFVPGNYRLEVMANGYKKYSQELVITNENKNYVQDIRLINSNIDKSYEVSSHFLANLKTLVLSFLKKFIDITYLLGFLLAISNAVFLPSAINFTVLVIYTIISALSLYKFFKRDSDATYTAVDSTTGYRIPNMILKFYELDSGELLDIQTTNEQGFFAYKLELAQVGVVPDSLGYRLDKNNTLTNIGQLQVAKIDTRNLDSKQLSLRK